MRRMTPRTRWEAQHAALIDAITMTGGCGWVGATGGRGATCSYCLRHVLIHRPRVCRDTYEWNHHGGVRQSPHHNCRRRHRHRHRISSNRTGAALGMKHPRGPRDAALWEVAVRRKEPKARTHSARSARRRTAISHITRPRGNWCHATRLENECCTAAPHALGRSRATGQGPPSE
jgi:hypothetical protein